MEDSMEVPQIIKNGTTIQSSISAYRYVSKENKNTNLKISVHRTNMFIAVQELDKGGQKVQTSSSKLNSFQVCNAQLD